MKGNRRTERSAALALLACAFPALSELDEWAHRGPGGLPEVLAGQ